MERLCPLLSLQDDRHAVVDGFDPAHRCHALEPPEALERAYQVSTCLQPSHTACPRYANAMRARVAGVPAPQPAPDVRLLSTRLVLAPDSSRVRVARAARSGRRWAAGAVLAAVAAVAVAGGVTGALESLEEAPGEASLPAADQSNPQAARAVPTPSPPGTVPTKESSPPSSTPEPPSAAPVAESTEPDGASTVPAPTPHSYVVQPGDTLNAIASRFGTSAVAIQQANGLRDSDHIVIGQVLAIP
ncbi:MAG TPA: LysM peptidoglycan-binding domain-containing protein [Candidatus Limnocylindria bacterium]|nr:LysM peptidoglycan-binding domain-containing protein [Candidatus Limnocylindria bacterium]